MSAPTNEKNPTPTRKGPAWGVRGRNGCYWTGVAVDAIVVVNAVVLLKKIVPRVSVPKSRVPVLRGVPGLAVAANDLICPVVPLQVVPGRVAAPAVPSAASATV